MFHYVKPYFENYYYYYYKFTKQKLLGSATTTTPNFPCFFKSKFFLSFSPLPASSNYHPVFRLRFLFVCVCVFNVTSHI